MFRENQEFLHYGKGLRGTNLKRSWVKMICRNVTVNDDGIERIQVVSASHVSAKDATVSTIGCAHNSMIIAIRPDNSYVEDIFND